MKRIGMWLFLFVPLLSADIRKNEENLYGAQALYDKGDYSGAIRLYRTVLQKDPKSELAHIGLIRSLWKNNDIQEAYKSAESAIAKFPENASLHAVKGDVLFRLAQISNAQKSYLKAISLDSQLARGYWGLGRIHAFDFNRKTAKKMMQKAYEFDPKDPDIISDYIEYLPNAEQIPLLEKYLWATSDEITTIRGRIANHLEYLKNSAGFKTGRFLDPPPEATIPLYEIVSDTERPASGYYIKAIINGKTANLQLDTGGSGILFQRRFIEKMGLNILSASEVKGIGDSGARAGFLAQAQNLQIGQLRYSDAILEVVDQNFTPNIDGIIGGNFFNRYLISLNFPQKRIELQPLPMINGKPYSNSDSWKELDRTQPSELASFQSIGIMGNLFIPVTINNKKTGYFMLDTGAEVSMLNREFASDLTGLLQSEGEIRGVSGAMKTYETTSSITLRMGQFSQRYASMFAVSFKDMSRDYGLEISGIIGNSLLQHLTITIDYRDGLVNFIYQK